MLKSKELIVKKILMDSEPREIWRKANFNLNLQRIANPSDSKYKSDKARKCLTDS